MKIPATPTIFAKFPTAVIGPGRAHRAAPLVRRSPTTRPSSPSSSAAAAATSPAANWREHVFGYTILNDVSARDYQMATTQWTIGKSFDTFAPMGPCIVTADEIADPHNLDIQLTSTAKCCRTPTRATSSSPFRT